MANPDLTTRLPQLVEWRARLRQPWLVAAWPGMGAVGQAAVAYLARQLDASPICELPTDGYFAPRAIEVVQGVIRPAQRPKHSLSGWVDPKGGRSLVLVTSEAQPEIDGSGLAEDLVAIARELGAVRVCTFAAMATTIRPEAAPRVFVAASSPPLLAEARQHGALPLTDGSIGGENGVLVEVAARRGVPSLCLLGEMPFYASAIANPKASAAVLRVFSQLACVGLDLAELDAAAHAVERSLVEHLRRMAGAAPKQPADRTLAADEPDAAASTARTAAAQRIEALFAAAQQDRSKAQALKDELDRLGLFREYEDRFLDLFKRAE